MSKELKLEDKDKALHIGSVIERFTIDDAKEMVKAWESLPEGAYDSYTISDWLMDDMKPVIDKFRAKILTIPDVVGRSEQLVCADCKQKKELKYCEDCYHEASAML